MGAMASQITSLTIVYSTVSDTDQRKHQSSASLAFQINFNWLEAGVPMDLRHTENNTMMNTEQQKSAQSPK